jgi:hypothetical protein
MHYVVLAEHAAEVCPTSNATTKALLLEMAPKIPSLAQEHGVNIVAGPFVNPEHVSVVIVETDRAEALDAFLVASRLHQWNRLRILPSQPMHEGLRDVEAGTSLF